MSTKINWTDETWNFLGGCTPCSKGCEGCAAARTAAVRFISIEPLLEEINFGDMKLGEFWCPECEEFSDEPKKYLCEWCSEPSSDSEENENGVVICKHCKEEISDEQPVCPHCEHAFGTHMLPYGRFDYFVESDRQYAVMREFDQVIVGCESLAGGRAGRFCEDEKRWWQAARDIKDQCAETDTAFFMKQGPINGRVVKDINLFPEDLRIREYPQTGE